MDTTIESGIKVRDFALEHLQNQQQNNIKTPPDITLSEPSSVQPTILTQSDKNSTTSSSNSPQNTNDDNLPPRKLKSPYSLPYSGVYLSEWTINPVTTSSYFQSPDPSTAVDIQDILASLTDTTGTNTNTNTYTPTPHKRAQSGGSDYSQYSTPLSNRNSSNDRDRDRRFSMATTGRYRSLSISEQATTGSRSYYSYDHTSNQAQQQDDHRRRSTRGSARSLASSNFLAPVTEDSPYDYDYDHNFSADQDQAHSYHQYRRFTYVAPEDPRWEH